MPYCTQCGNQVGEPDLFCASCGAAQRPRAAEGHASRSSGPSGATPPPPPPNDAARKIDGFLRGMSNRQVSLLCYLPVIGWIPALAALASARFQHDLNIRFHAFQGLYLFVAWLIADWVIEPMSRSSDLHLDGVLKAIIIAAGVFMMVKTSHNEHYRLPVFGELAERSANEQR